VHVLCERIGYPKHTSSCQHQWMGLLCSVGDNPRWSNDEAGCADYAATCFWPTLLLELERALGRTRVNFYERSPRRSMSPLDMPQSPRFHVTQCSSTRSSVSQYDCVPGSGAVHTVGAV
jgi:hypothetical protein